MHLPVKSQRGGHYPSFSAQMCHQQLMSGAPARKIHLPTTPTSHTHSDLQCPQPPWTTASVDTLTSVQHKERNNTPWPPCGKDLLSPKAAAPCALLPWHPHGPARPAPSRCTRCVHTHPRRRALGRVCHLTGSTSSPEDAWRDRCHPCPVCPQEGKACRREQGPVLCCSSKAVQLPSFIPAGAPSGTCAAFPLEKPLCAQGGSRMVYGE